MPLAPGRAIARALGQAERAGFGRCRMSSGFAFQGREKGAALFCLRCTSHDPADIAQKGGGIRGIGTAQHRTRDIGEV